MRERGALYRYRPSVVENNVLVKTVSLCFGLLIEKNALAEKKLINF
jgi:hypothetical protein